MAGKKGGLLNSIGNATGLNEVAGGTARYMFNPIASMAEDQMRQIRGAKREAKAEIARQEGIQRENERMASEQKQTQETARGFREQRSRQRMLAASRQGRASTILTSPLGSTGPAAAAPEAGGKKLLGE